MSVQRQLSHREKKDRLSAWTTSVRASSRFSPLVTSVFGGSGVGGGGADGEEDVRRSEEEVEEEEDSLGKLLALHEETLPPPPPVPDLDSDAELSSSESEGDGDEAEGRIEKQGWLTKEGRIVHSWKRRWFILRGSSLSYYTQRTRKLKGTIPLDTCVVRPAHGKKEDKDCLELITEGRKLYFYAESADEQQSWVNALNNKIVNLTYQRKLKALNRPPNKRLLDFFSNPNAEELVLDFNSDMLEGVVALEQVIRYHTHIRKLSLCSCALTSLELSALLQGLIQNQSIKVLDLRNNNLDGEGADILAEVLVRNKTIQEVYLDGNKIGSVGLKAICRSFENHSNLTVLSVNNNCIGEEGAEAYAVALGTSFGKTSTYPNIRTVSLNGNKIGDGSVPHLVRAFLANPNVQCLQLSSAAISNDGVAEIANLLRNPDCKLKSVDLSFNEITTRGVEDLADAFSKNINLKDLSIGGNRFTDQSLRCLAEADEHAVFSELEIEIVQE